MQYNAYIWVLWDIAAVLVLVYYVGTGASRGLVRTAVSLLGFVAAVSLGNLLSPIIAAALYDGIVRDALRMVITGRLEDLLSGSGGGGQLIDAVPGILQGLLTGDAAGAISGEISGDALLLVEGFIEAALREPVLSIISGIVFLLVFSLTMLVARHVARMFTVVYKIPVIGTINTLLGGIIGVLEAVVVLFVAAIGCQLIIAFSGGGFFWLNDRVLDDTYIFRAFYTVAGF